MSILERTHVSLTEQQRLFLLSAAKRSGISFSEIVRMIIADFIKSGRIPILCGMCGKSFLGRALWSCPSCGQEVGCCIGGGDES